MLRMFNLDGVDHVLMTQEAYENLIESEEKLATLEACGVDNWSGYGEAMSEYYGGSEED